MNGFENLRQVAKDLEAGGRRTETVRTVLSWFGAQRRGINIAVLILLALRKARLETFPPFDSAPLDLEVEFRLAAAKPPVPAVEPSGGGVEELALVPEETLTVGLLTSADRTPVTVARDTLIREARSLMLIHDYSQLPVVNGRQVVGMFSWKSMGEAVALGRECSRVGDCMYKDALVLEASTPLLDAVEQIIAREVAVIRREGQLVGVVTTSDLSQQFHESARAYLLLGTIEVRLRALISTFPKEVLNLTRAEAVPVPPVPATDDVDVNALTFGEYVRLLQREAAWTHFSTTLERGVVVSLLDDVREIRNDVMHFHTDPLGDGDFEKLTNAARLLDLLLNARPAGKRLA